jgi:hypothetical protein
VRDTGDCALRKELDEEEHEGEDGMRRSSTILSSSDSSTDHSSLLPHLVGDAGHEGEASTIPQPIPFDGVRLPLGVGHGCANEPLGVW